MLSKTWIVLGIFRLVASSTIGYSGILTNDVSINPGEYNVIKSWSVPDNSRFYDYDSFSKENGFFIIPVEGVYFLGANIKVKASEAELLEISFNDARDDISYCRAVAHLTSNTEQAISLSCFARFLVKTKLSLKLKNTKKFEVVLGSTICVQYIGMVGHLTSFVLPLRNVTTVDDKVIISVKMNIREYRYFNTLTDLSNLADIAVPCSGIYIISLNAIVSMNEKSTFTLYVDNTVLLNVVGTDSPENTINILQTVQLRKGDKVTVKLKHVVILPGSTYSLIRLGDVDKVQGLYTAVNTIIGDDRDKLYRIPFNISDAKRPYFVDNSFIKNPVNNDYSRMQFKYEGLYMFSMHIEASSSQTENVKLYINIRRRNSLWTISRRGNKNKSNYFTLNGFLRLKDYDEVSVHIEKSQGFKILPNSHLSITKIRANTFASTSEIPPTSQSVIKCNKKWTVLSGFETTSDLNLNTYLKMDRYIIPSSGIYLIIAEVSVKYSGEATTQNIILALARKRPNGDIKRLLQSIAMTTKKPRKLSIRHVFKFQKDDSVMLQMTCNKSIEFVHKTKLEIIFLRNVEDKSYFGLSNVENKVIGDPPGMYLSKYNQWKAPADGIFFVTVTTLIKYTNLQKKSVKVSMYVYVERNESTPNIRWLRSIEYFNVDEMGSAGTVTLQVSGFLEMTRDHVINLRIDYPNKTLSIYRASEHVAMVALNNSAMSQYRFKSFEDSKLQFILDRSKYTIENFNSFSVIYKSEDVRFHGQSSFIVNKPMLILYDFSVELRDAQGEFKIELKIYPRPGMTQLSENIVVPQKDNIMVKIVGVLELKQSELVELVIFGTSTSYVMSYHRSWSVIELVAPTAKRHQVELIKTSSDRPHDLSTLASVQAIYPGMIGPNLPQDIRLVSAHSPSPSPISSNFPIWLHTFNLKADIVNFSSRYTKDLQFSLQNIFHENTFVNKYGVVSFVQVKVDSPLTEVNIYLKRTNKRNVVFYSPKVDKPIILLLCLSPYDKLDISSSLVTSSLVTPGSAVSGNSSKNASSAISTGNSQLFVKVAITPIDFIKNVNGFSGMIRDEKKMGNLGGTTARIVNWFSDDLPFFHKAPGLIPVEGVFILESNGYYFLSVNIIVEAVRGGCHLLLTADEMDIFSEEITQRVTSITDVVWLQKNLFLQAQVRCQTQADRESISIQMHSTLSIFLIESQPSFASRCSDNNLEVQSNIRNESLNVAYGRNVELKCFDKSSAMGDFIWKRDDKVVYQIQGRREAKLELKHLTPNENGKYHCEMKRGHQTAKMKPLGIMVIDPRPKLFISNNTVYIGENYSANKLLAWIKVEAKNVKTNQLAKVRFSIIEGNDDNNFLTKPAIHLSHTSLLFNKPFDYEKKSTYKLTINAENLENEGDGGNATISIIIHVVNNNEHRPRFTTAKSRFTVLENTGVGTRLYTFKAGDLDDDSIRYSLALNSNLFRIDKLTGEFFVNGSIDYEINKELFLIICASDSLYKTCMNVQISVLNENDNDPHFTQTTYTVNVTKVALPGTTVLTLRAADDDDKGDENLSFVILNGNEEKYFAIDGNKIKLIKEYVGPTKSIHMQVCVKDRLFESLTPATVNINFIGDDPIPKFSKKVYQVDVPEDVVKGSKVTKLDVKYKGKTVTGSSTQINFSIKNLKSITNEYFTIDEEANIIAQGELDYESTKTIVLLVSACVRVRKKDKCGICHVTVNVLDVNDNRPVFQERLYTTQISEHLANGTRFTKVKATDADSEGENSRITYFIEDTFDLFDIDNRTGELYTTRDIEVSDGTYFELSVGAKDSGTPVRKSSYFCEIRVTILQTNPVEVRASKTEGLLGLKNWEFWILPCLGTVVLLLILVVATIFWKYRRSRRRFHEYVIEQPIVQDNNRNSFLTYLTKPASSQEETMYLSCGSLPSAYNSEKDIPKAVTSYKEKTSSVIFSENGYSTFANEDDECVENDGTNV